jgi:Protein of unknown function DUF45.
LKQRTKAVTHKMHKVVMWNDDEELRWSVQQWATRMGVKVPPFCFQMMEAKWETITRSGWLTLDPLLLRLPKALGGVCYRARINPSPGPEPWENLQALPACVHA